MNYISEQCERDEKVDAWAAGVPLEAEGRGGALWSLRIRGEQAERVESGGGFRVEVDYETPAAYDGWNAALVFSLSTIGGVEVLRLSTQPISGYDLGRLGIRGTIHLLIRDLPLVEGAVIVGLALTRPNLETVLNLPEAGRLDIHGVDFCGSGYVPHQSRGLVLSRHEWPHESA